VTLSAELTYNVLARQTDQAGNGPTASLAITLTIDKTAPAAPSISGISAGYYNANQTFTVSGEAGATIEYSTNNGGLWTAYTGAVTLSAQGTYNVLARQTDQAGNGPTASGATTLTIDKTAPAAPSISGISAGYYNTNQTFTVSGEAGATIEYSTNNGGLWTAYSGAVTLSAEGTYNVLARQTDQAGNGPTASGAITLTIDKTAPTVTISSTSTASTNVSPIPVTIAFNESVSGFVVGDLTLGNCTATNFSGSGASYSVDITPGAEGIVTINVAGSMAQDAAGNNNTAATQLSRIYDITLPTVISINRSSATPTNLSSVNFLITFSETVIGVTTGNFSLTGSASAASISGISGSGNTRTVSVTTGSTDGSLGLDLSSILVITDNASNSLASTHFGDQTYTIDKTTQTPILTLPAINSATGDNLSIDFNIPETAFAGSVKMTFTESGTALDGNDPHIITFKSAFESIGQHTTTLLANDFSNNSYVNSVSSGGNDKLVDGAKYDVKIEYQDPLQNTASIATNTGLIYESTPPSLDIIDVSPDPRNSAVTSVLLKTTNNPTRYLTVAHVDPGKFKMTRDGANVVLTGNCAVTVAHYKGGSTTLADQFTITFQNNITAPDGVYNFWLDHTAGEIRTEGNNLVTSDPSDTWTMDATAPTITITVASVTSANPVPVTIDFSEDVSGFAIGDIGLTNGWTKSNFVTVNARKYTVNLTPVSRTSSTISLALNAAQDAAGNQSVATSANTSYYPVPTVTSSAGKTQCGTAAFNLSATPSNGVIDWYDASTGGTYLHTGNTYSPTITIPGTYNYYAEGNDNTIKSASRTLVTAVINPVPTVSLNPATSTATCAGTWIMVSATVGGGTAPLSSPSASWSGTAAAYLNTNTILNPSFSASAGSYTLTYTATDVNSCNATASLAITVSAALAGGSIDPVTSPVCSGNNTNTLNLTGNTAPVVRWEYSRDASFTTFNAINTSSTTITANNIDSTRVYRAVVDGGVCGTTLSATRTITVNPRPAVSILPLTLCAKAEGTLNATVTGGDSHYVYSWTGGTANDSLSSTTVEDPKYKYRIDATTTRNLTLTVSDNYGAGCTSSTSIGINVNKLPTVTIINPTATIFIKKDTTVNLQGTPSNGIFTGEGVLTSQKIFNPNLVTNLNTDIPITYTYTDGNFCTNSKIHNVQVQLASAQFANMKAVYCFRNPQDTVSITATKTMYYGSFYLLDKNSNYIEYLNNASFYNPSTASYDKVIIDPNHIANTWGSGEYKLYYYGYAEDPITFMWTWTTLQQSFQVEDAGTTSISGLNAKYCYQDSKTYPLQATNVSSGAKGYWVGPSGDKVTNTTSYPFKPFALSPGNHTITFIDTTTHGCPSNLVIASFDVNRLPKVSILNDTIFNITSSKIKLIGSQLKGQFFGVGVSTEIKGTDTTYFFNPSQFGVEKINSSITYTADSAGCQNTTSAKFDVLKASEIITLPKDTMCYDDAAFSFTIHTNNRVPSIMNPKIRLKIKNQNLVDDSTLTFVPSVIGDLIGSSQTGIASDILEYSYYYKDTLFKIEKPFTIQKVQLQNNNLAFETSYCVDANAIFTQVFNQKPSGGTSVWSATFTDAAVFTSSSSGHSATLYPKNVSNKDIVNSGNISYYYQTAAGCKSQTITKTIAIHNLPQVSISNKTVYNVAGSPEPLIGSYIAPTDSFSFSAVAGIIKNGKSYNFSPSLADVRTNLPITYTYTDGFGCTNSTSILVDVFASNVTVTKAGGPANNVFCYYSGSDTYNAVIINPDDTKYNITGSSFSDNKNLIKTSTATSAVIDPSLITASTVDSIVFEYFLESKTDPLGRTTRFSKTIAATIEKLNLPEITGLDSLYCNENSIKTIKGAIEGDLKSRLQFTGPLTGFISSFEQASLTPSAVGIIDSPIPITLKYTSENNCSRQVTKYFIIKALPDISIFALPQNNRNIFFKKEPKIFLCNGPDSTFSGNLITVEKNKYYLDPSNVDILSDKEYLTENSFKKTIKYSANLSCSSEKIVPITIAIANAKLSGFDRNNNCLSKTVKTITADVKNGLPSTGKFIESKALKITNSIQAEFTGLNGKEGWNKIEYHYKNSQGTEFIVEDSIQLINPAPPTFTIDKKFICHQDRQIKLSGNPTKGYFSINNVKDSINTVDGIYYFNPTNYGKYRITYTNTSNSICYSIKDSIVPVYETPVAKLTIDPSCYDKDSINVKFADKSTHLADSTKIKKWDWTFLGDVAGYTKDTLQNPLHRYLTNGRKQINLKVTTANQCSDDTTIDYVVYPRPVPAFNWNNECLIQDEPIKFSGGATHLSGYPVNYKWNIVGNGIADSKLTDTISALEYMFTNVSDYKVTLTATYADGSHCAGSKTETFHLKPIIDLASDNAVEKFENGTGFWYADAANKADSLIWKFGNTPAASFAGNDGNCWYPDFGSSTTAKAAWISSPCFNFSDMKKPMVTMKMRRKLEASTYGARIQYKLNSKDTTWTTLGKVSDGINWYNSSNITNLDVTDRVGWAGKTDNNWVETRHSLDPLLGSTTAQLRIYAAINASENGIAIDDIKISDRKKVAVVEHFTNVGVTKTDDPLASEIGANDFLSICYHTDNLDSPGNDEFFNLYPAAAKSRALYYNLGRSMRYSLIDGGYGEKLNNRIDYNTLNWSRDYFDSLSARVLKDPVFALQISIKYDASLTTTAALKALKDMKAGDYTLYLAVVEKEAKSGSVTYSNVIRKMLPNPGGKLYSQAWTKDQTTSETYTWNYLEGVNNANLRIVAFVQNDSTKEIYAARTDDVKFINHGVKNDSIVVPANLGLEVYPNPTTERVFVSFEKPLKLQTRIEIYNQLNQLVVDKKVETGTQVGEVNLFGLKKGIYFLRVSDGESISSIKKLVIAK
jgi:hypothetical protein